MNASVIYKILNKVDGKFYIGSAVNVTRRWYDHKRKLRYGRHINKHLQSAYNKYGVESFEYIILENVADIANLVAREQFWIDETNCCDNSVGYNRRPTANSQIGFKHSPETIALYKQRKMSAEHAKAFNRSGKTISDAHKAKVSKAQKGKPKSAEHRANVKKSWIRRKAAFFENITSVIEIR